MYSFIVCSVITTQLYNKGSKMINAEFVLKSDNQDYFSFINSEYNKLKNAIDNSINIELITSFRYLEIESISDFDDFSWKPLGVPKLGIKEKAQLVINEELKENASQDDILKFYLTLLSKKVAILELQPILQILPDQENIEVANKLVRYRINFN